MRRVLVSYFFVLSAIYFYGIQRPKISINPAKVGKAAGNSVDERFSEEQEREEKKDGYSRFGEFHRQLRTPDNQDAPSYTSNYQLEQLRKSRERLNLLRTSASALEWKSRGPGNIPGRTRALVVLPQDATGRSWLAGSVGGGVWKTVNAGGSWTNITPDLPNLAISSLALCSSSPSVIYAGSGESFGNLDAIGGAGIFKSTDGGVSWTQLSSTVQDNSFRAVNRIIVDPNNPDVVVACSNTSTGNFSDATSGIYRSDNGGTTWTKVYASDSYVQQVIAAPADFNVQYASVSGVGVLKSTDGGKTWVSTSTDIKAGGRIELAISSGSANTLAASVVGNLSGEAGADLYFSTDGGASWAYVSESEDENFDFLEQGDYDNAIMFHPFNDKVVYVGGVNMFKFTIDTENPGQLKTINAFEKTGTSSFIDFVEFSGNVLQGLELGEIASDSLVDVEIRFGPGIEQKAARFTVDKQGAGVPAGDYTFRDYVSVPFQAWDNVNNRQLMVSFRDQQEDGSFNLITLNTEGGAETHSREYFYVHLLEYSENVDPGIAEAGGHEHKMMLNFWPVLPAGGSWSSDNLPESSLSVSFSTLNKLKKSVKVVADGYGEHKDRSGGSWVNPTTTIHVDHHFLTAANVSASNSSFRIISANDGGVFLTAVGTDPGTANGDWRFAGNGMVTGQFYGVDKRPGVPQYIGGLQDNSTAISIAGEDASANSAYQTVIGGDGFETLWNNADDRLVIASAQFNTFYRSTDHGKSWQPAVSGLPLDYENESPFFSRLSNSRSNPEILFTVAAGGVYSSPDFGLKWSQGNMENGWSFRGSFTNVEVSKANPLIVWAGGAMSGSQTLQVSTDRGRNFRKVSNYQGDATLQGVITGIESHPFEDSTAFALFSFQGLPKVLRTMDLGSSWQDISGFGTNAAGTAGFPDVAVYSLLVLPNDPSVIWAGTEIGIYETTNDGISWAPLPEFPAVAVWEMKTAGDEVVVATHGRGIWTATLDNVPEVVLAPNIKSVGIKPSGILVAELEMRSAYDSTHIIGNGMIKKKLAAGTVENLSISFPSEAMEIDLMIKSFKAGRSYVSTNKIATGDYNLPVASYSNNFDGSSGVDDFYGNGFSLSKPLGFTSKAIHSEHNYPDDSVLYFTLKTPVVIDEEVAVFSYRDIAVVETGEEGAVFGDTDFFDYVVVEGSTDGATWKPLSAGYDASYNEGWKKVVEGGAGSEALYVQRRLNLLRNFSHGDTVLFRFKLFADQDTNAWGWAIDDLIIQEEKLPTGIENAASSPWRIYPVPVYDHLNIDAETNEVLNIIIYDLTGQVSYRGMVKTVRRRAELDLEGLRNGFYLISISSGTREMTFRFIKS